MKVGGKRVMLCSCDGTMPLDANGLAQAFGTEGARPHRQLCRAEIAAYRQALQSGETLMVACGQEAPLFAEIAEEMGVAAPAFVDLRDRAGWSDEAAQATPKMAALLAEAGLELQPTPVVTLRSEGSVLILGGDDAALEAARRLAADRAVQVLLVGKGDVAPPATRVFGLWRGRPLRAEGYLGRWTITVAGMAAANPSSRAVLAFDAPREATSELAADLVLDLTGETPLIRRRDGWLVADPRVPAQVEKALAEARDLVGEFEKPRYIKLDPSLCAHARNTKIACTRCLDACPSSAITPKGDHAAIDAHACGGHGACASACPTGAIRYDFPADNGLFTRLATVLETHAAAGGAAPLLLVHDTGHGTALIGALARFGAGLPSRVLPFAVNAVAALGVDFALTALAKGAARLVVLADPARHHDFGPLRAALDLANQIQAALGWSSRAEMLVAADPAELAAHLTLLPDPVRPAADFAVMGGKRSTLSLALSHLHRHASIKVDMLPLETGAPFGAVLLDADKCTLCLACVSVCPAQALSGHPDKPSLGFVEANCVQCGLCKVTCPEAAIRLQPQINFSEISRNRLVLKEEEAFACISCGKPFGTKSAIERMVERLSSHPMFATGGKLDLIKMCESCRVTAQYQGEEGSRPMAQGTRPVTRTAEDYK